MISYSTHFPLKQGVSVAEVVKLGHRWIAGSPHSKIKLSALCLPDHNDEQDFILGDERVSTLIVSGGGESISAGIRYSQISDEKIEWVTTLSCTRIDEKIFVGVQVSCDKEGGVPRLPPARKPHLIKMLLGELGGGDDGDIPVADKAIPLPDSSPAVAAALMTGEARNSLPIIYISRGYDERLGLDPERLVRFVSGAAHVVCEPSRRFSISLRSLVGRAAVYGGNIGIYWPDGAERWNFFPVPGENPKELILDIWRSVRNASVHRRVPSKLGWLYLREQLAKHRIELVRNQGNADVEAYTKAFDDEISAKQDRIDELERELARALATSSRPQGAATGGELLKSGPERDFYDGETIDILIDALEQYKGYVPPESRRLHLIDSLLKVNDRRGNGGRIDSEIKAALRSYKDMDRATRKVLEEFGFSISEDGKHYKVVYHDDARYAFTIAKTASDHRAGLNIAGEISRKIF
ncbi:hypothetical protein [Xanthomonas bundabergensis]|uniref:hypothetical protein n=1 Tax=Xanthomonas bundabergensis TaxID=3160842 RepID=UPI003512C816